MKSAAALLFLLLAVPLAALGEDIRDKKVDGNSAVSRYNSGRVADLPTNEADKLYLTLTTGDDWQSDPRQRQVAGWFASEPRLAQYKAQMRWNWYTTSNPLFKERLKKYYGTNVPIVSVQAANGDTLMNVTGLSMPRTAGELADMMADSLEARFAPPTFEGQTTQTPIEREQCPDGNCPINPPAVDPNDGAAPLIPEKIPSKTPLPNDFAFWGVVLLIGGGGGCFVLIGAAVLAAAFARRPAPATNRPGIF